MNVLFPFPKTSKCIKFYLQTDLIIIIVPKRRRGNLWQSEAATRGVKNFATFTGKHLFWSLFLIKLLALRHAALSKRDTDTAIFM